MEFKLCMKFMYEVKLCMSCGEILRNSVTQCNYCGSSNLSTEINKYNFNFDEYPKTGLYRR